MEISMDREACLVISSALTELEDPVMWLLPATVLDVLTTISYHLPIGCTLSSEVNDEIFRRAGKPPHPPSPEFKEVLNAVADMIF